MTQQTNYTQEDLGVKWNENDYDYSYSTFTPAGAVVAPCSDEDGCTLVSCEVCLKEIPGDTVRLADAQEYVHHFCGLDCLEIWQKQAAIRPQPSPAECSNRLK